MTTSVRDILHSKGDPRAPSPTRSASPPRMAQPLDLLGAPPRNDIVYVSPAAQALSSAEAADIQSFPPPPPPEGLGLDLLA